MRSSLVDEIASGIAEADTSRLSALLGPAGLAPLAVTEPAAIDAGAPRAMAFAFAYWNCLRDPSAAMPPASAVDHAVLRSVPGAFEVRAVGSGTPGGTGASAAEAVELALVARCAGGGHPLAASAGGGRHWLMLPLGGADGSVASVLLATSDEAAPPAGRTEARPATDRDDGLLRLVLDSIDQGVSLFSADDHLILYNRRWPEIMNVPQSLIDQRPSQEELVRFQANRGELTEFGDDPEERVRFLVDKVRRAKAPMRYERARADGRIIEVMIKPLPDGRQIRVFTDVTGWRHAEQRLQENEGLLRETLDNLDASVIVYDEAGRYVLGNKGFHQQFPHYPDDSELAGKTFEEMLRMSMAAGAVPDPLAKADPDAYVAKRLQHRREDRPGVYEQRHAGGRWSLVRTHRTPEGKTIALRFDISARKRIEQELAAKTATLETTLENMGDGIAVYDQDLRVIVHNRLMREYLGLPESMFDGEATAGRNVRYMAEHGLYGAGDPAEQAAGILAGFRSEATVTRELAMADGRVIEVHHRPLPDGRIVRRYADITARKQAEHELATKTSILEVMLENMGDGIALFDADLRLIIYNQLALNFFDIREDELARDPTAAGIIRHSALRGDYGPGDPEEHVARYLTTFHADTPTRFEIVGKSGRTVEIHHIPLLDGRYVRRYVDITDRKRAEQELASKTEVLAATLESIRDGISVIDENLNVIAANHLLLEMMNLPESYITDLPFPLTRALTFLAERGDYGPGDVAEHVATRLAGFLPRETRTSEITFPDGRVFEIHHRPIAGGMLLRSYADITERRRAERALASQTEILAATLESIRDGITMVDENLNIVAMNRRELELLGLPEDEFFHVPQPLINGIRYLAERGDYGPGDVDELVERRMAVFRSREYSTGELSMPDGRIIEVHHRPLAGGMVLRSYSDITERKRAEATLRAHQQEIEALLDAIPLPVMLAQPETRTFLQANQRARDLYGIDAAEGGTYREILVDPADRAKFAAQLRRDGHVEEFETRFSAASGEEIWALISARIVRYRDTEAVLAVHTLINERKQLETDLREARDQAEAGARAKSTFLANMSHEIRTPLNGVVANLELLGLTRLDHEQSDLVHSAEVAARTLLTIIGEVLDFSKIEANRIEIERIEVDPGTVVEEVVALMQTTARRKTITLTAHVGDGVPRRVLTDPVRVRQVLLNLVGNAVKFTAEGSVHLSVEREGDAAGTRLRFLVEDTGIGIDLARAGDLFTPFTQADLSTQRRFGGTGLGLAISKHMAELLGGSIDCDSAPGDGSTFSVAIPVPVIVEADAAAEPTEDLSGAAILLVSDDAATAEAVHAALGPTGASVARARTLADARARLRGQASSGRPLDVVISDDRLPDGTGLDLAAAMPGAASGYMLLCGRDDLPTRRQAYRAGFQRCVPKPVRPDEMRRLVAVATGRRAGESTGITIGERLTALPRFAAGLPVLVVEDNPVNQAVARRQLRAVGLDCVVAGDGRAGLRALDTQPFALILLDLWMPELDGIAMAREVRQRERDGGGGDRIPIVALSASVVEKEQQSALEAGMDAYLSKPIDLLRLAETLARWLPVDAAQPVRPPLQSPAVERPPEPAGTAADAPPPVDLAAFAEALGIEDPAELTEVLGLLLETLPEQMEAVAAAVAAGDPDVLYDTAHAAKGAAGNARARRLAALLEDMEQAGRAADIAAAEQLLPEVQSSYRAVVSFVSALQSGTGGE